MFRLIPAVAALLALAQAAAAPQNGAIAPAAGSAERRAILAALRPGVERRLGVEVEFVVERIAVQRGTAFVSAEPRRRDGGAIDGPAIFGEAFENMDGLTVTAIMTRLGSGRWLVSEMAIGATDAWYCNFGSRPIARVTGC